MAGTEGRSRSREKEDVCCIPLPTVVQVDEGEMGWRKKVSWSQNLGFKAPRF